VLDDGWRERVDITIKVMYPIISLLWFADIDQSILVDAYEGWEYMIDFVKTVILENECREYVTSTENLFSLFNNIWVILINRW